MKRFGATVADLGGWTAAWEVAGAECRRRRRFEGGKFMGDFLFCCGPLCAPNREASVAIVARKMPNAARSSNKRFLEANGRATPLLAWGPVPLTFGFRPHFAGGPVSAAVGSKSEQSQIPSFLRTM
jgi:hypothetical protein